MEAVVIIVAYMITLKSKGRVAFFHCFFITIFSAVFLSACSTSSNDFQSRGLASKAAIAASVPVLQKFYLNQAPIRPASSSAYPIVDSLPGEKFNRNRLELRPMIDFV